MRSDSVVLERARISMLAQAYLVLTAMMKRSRTASRPPHLRREDLTPHMARDLGLTDGMEKSSLSPGIIEQAPRL
ncbi:hypothetical protein [Tianweitania sp.]|uniref:hypothetical protein n=1 Tax=Tianweitania sp. TaxID=2021634 RepID=UPI0028A0DD79|nr:hypothetical protein [Tianweitania sp.]